MKAVLYILCFLVVLGVLLAFKPTPLPVRKQAAKPKNIIFILSDDHRYDFMGFTGKVPGLNTPNLDRLARNGVHVRNAFVSTALCSPSRASILSGQYAHTHRVVDNFAPLTKGLKFFPQYLQRAGYKTAFLGKWHMGNTDDAPQPGFNHWVSFKGQGVYYNPTLNVDGKQVSYTDSNYTTDLLTDYAVKWLTSLDKTKPFCLYLSHKAVHAEFQPAKRHRGLYKDMRISYPQTMFLTATDSSKNWPVLAGNGQVAPNTPLSAYTPAGLKANTADMPNWVKQQRYSWHGVDYMYHGTISFNNFYRQYCETLMGVDDSVGRVLRWLENNGQLDNTLVVYMGDNGFSFGERGLIDKRHMYEESMRVPLLVHCPSLTKGGSKLEQVVQNVDIAPTLMAYAGLVKPAQMQGTSFLPLLQGKTIPWRDQAFYEYYWEADFPQTPTMFGVRNNRYKYVFNHGVWDANELYDLQNDPQEVNNLIRSPQHQEIAKAMRNQVFDWLEKSGGLQIPLHPVRQPRFDHRYQGTY